MYLEHVQEANTSLLTKVTRLISGIRHPGLMEGTINWRVLHKHLEPSLPAYDQLQGAQEVERTLRSYGSHSWPWLLSWYAFTTPSRQGGR